MIKVIKIIALIFVFCGSIHSLQVGDVSSIAYIGKLYEHIGDSNVITILKNSDKVRVVQIEGEWVRVKSGDYVGWVHKESIYDNFEKFSHSKTTQSPEKEGGINPYLYLITMPPLLIIVLLILRGKSKKEKFLVEKTDTMSEIVVIVCESEKAIKSNVFEAYKKMGSCFTDLGLDVIYTNTLHLEIKDIPLLFVFDTELCKNTKRIESIYIQNQLDLSLPALFYNIAKPENYKAGKILQKAYYFNHKINETDILKIIGKVLSKHKNKDEEFHLQGKLTESSLIEIIQMVSISGKQGLIKIYNSNSKVVGLIGFNKGFIIYAKTNHNREDKAVEEILTFTSGYFEYIEGYNVKETIQIDPMSILLKRAQFLDEKGDRR